MGEALQCSGHPRGGTSIVYCRDLLYRMNAFYEKTEQGGSIDIFYSTSQAWSSKTFPADDVSGPDAQSVSALMSVTVDGRDMLITLFGERDPSSLGHAGVDKMRGDCWLYDIAAERWQKVEFPSAKAPPPRGLLDADPVDKCKVVGCRRIERDQ